MKYSPEDVLNVAPYVSDEVLILVTDFVNVIVSDIEKNIENIILNRQYYKSLGDTYHSGGSYNVHDAIREIDSKANVKAFFISHLGRVLGSWWKYVKVEMSRDKDIYGRYYSVEIRIQHDPVNNKYIEVIH
jgi:hypothetical protein